MPFADEWKVIVGVTVPVISILLISVLVMIYQQIQRQKKLDSERHQSLNHETNEQQNYAKGPDQLENINYGGNAMDMEVSVPKSLLSVYNVCTKYPVDYLSL